MPNDHTHDVRAARLPARNGEDAAGVPHALRLEFIKFLANPPSQGFPASLKDAANAVALQKAPSGSNPMQDCIDHAETKFDKCIRGARAGFSAFLCCVEATGDVMRCAGGAGR
jgi:hypothetical protein